MPVEVSLVIPVSGGAAELSVQLASVAAQEVDRPLEVLVVTNGAPPAVEAVVRAFEADLPRVRMIDASDRRGAAHARNVGAAAATGSVLLFVDADDQLAPGYVRAMVGALDGLPFVAGRLDVKLLNRELPDSYTDAAEQAELPTSFGHLPFSAGCSLGIHRTLFEAVGGFDEELMACEDVDFCWRVQYTGVELVRVDDAVLRYRLRGGIRAALRQGYAHAHHIPRLYRKHRSLGMPRRSWRTAIRHQLGVLRLLARARGRGDVLHVAYLAGSRWGLVTGSLRARVAYL